MRAALATLTLLAALPGCFFVLDRDDDDEPPPEPTPEPFENFDPEFIEDETWWTCEEDPTSGDFFFEFQAGLSDNNGLDDIADVHVTVHPAGDLAGIVDDFAIFDEGDGLWGGVVWEGESNLFCTEPIDVAFEAWDAHGGYARLLIRY